MTKMTKKGFFERAADRLRGKRATGSINPIPTDEIEERGPAQHPDDDRMHISGSIRGGIEGIRREGERTNKPRVGGNVEREGVDRAPRRDSTDAV